VIIATADDPENPVQVTCEQTAPALWRPPRGRWSTIDRGGRIGILSYDGQDPYELLLSIRLDGYPANSVEESVRILEGFAEVPGGQQEPPILVVEGAIPKPHPSLKWRLTAIEDPTDVLFLPGGKSRCRYTTQVTLTQHVIATSLVESLTQTKATKGLQAKTTSVRPNEVTLTDVARRYYNDPSRASDIARANFKNGNPLMLGARLTPGTQLRMPA
jgi:hypothetical protein